MSPRKLTIVAVAVGLLACRETPQEKAARSARLPKPLEGKPAAAPAAAPIARDFEQVAEDKTLAVLFTFNSTGYFVYRGETMGFEYELLNAFATESGLRLKPVVARDSKVLFEALNRGDADVVAAQLAASLSEREVLMSDPLYSTAPVVVQRGSGAPAKRASGTVKRATERERRETAAPLTVRARLITRPADLGGERVHVAKVSPYRRRLLELNVELSDDIEVVEVDETTDRLITRLAEGNIAYTVAAENVAALRTGEFANLVIKPAIGPPQPVVWAVRKTSPNLHAALNQWLAAKRADGLLNALYRKYFLDRRGYHKRVESRYLTGETGHLSPYDGAFREAARIPVWDWRLVAAQAYQESRFDPRARSWAGAIGLMQIMPKTARELKVDPRDPEASVAAACRYLKRMESAWQPLVPRRAERLKFVLASYNVGLGHVEDAVRLAQKNGDDAASWENVAYWLIRKSKRDTYNDPVVKYGFARGTEPVGYVDAILTRWDHYREFVSDQPLPEATPSLGPEATPTPEPTPPPDRR
ncbi:MAG TPA: transporter substrate-binding domain-containing protein [Thermoanaerobaculia bacterium]|nr:transporter substrate-binding domain-containing protein [Thermoanaerobaculia bacterium]